MNAQGAASRFWLPALVIMCVGCVVFFAGLWSSGFSMSEGHRVAPAYEMLRTHDYFLPHMFEQAYLRKPPGMPWAIALFTSLFGHSEFAARAVSGVSMIFAGIASAWFARRWFGNGAALAAGLMHVLMPWMWESGRAAEIEALNNLGTSLAVWGLIDLVAFERRGKVPIALLAATGIFIAAMAKGPASLPVLFSAPLAACIFSRSLSPLKSAAFWSAFALAGAALGTIAVLIVRRARLETDPIVTQGVEEFLWSLSKSPQIVLLPIVFAASSLPASLALAPGLFARELDAGKTRIARTLSITVLLSLLAYTFAGVSNPRYTLPAAAILSPLMGFAIEAWKMQSGEGNRAAKMLVKVCKPAAVVLVLSALGYAFLSEQRRGASSGRAAGLELAALLEDGALICANDMIEARPEVLLYAIDEATRAGKHVQVRWTPDLRRATSALPLAHSYLLLRSDSGSKEIEELKSSGALAHFEPTTFHAKVGPANRPFEMVLYRARP